MISIEEATLNDNLELLALTQATPMNGVISLRIDRSPAFFQLLKLRGTGKVFIARADGRIVGCISVVYRSVFVDGKPQRVGYVGDLKVHPSFQGSRVALKLTQALFGYAMRQDVDLYFCVVASGNEKAFSFLQGRLGIPPFQFVGRFRVYEILTSPNRLSSKSYEIEDTNVDDIHEVCRLCNQFNTSYQFVQY